MKARYLILTFVTSFAAAGGAGFFAGVNFNRAHSTKTASTATTSQVTSSANASSETPSSSSTNSDVTTANTGASATDSQVTYIVKKGQTLYSIGKEVGIDWPTLASVNGLTETSVLKEGQVLKIPSQTEAQTVQAREYKVVTTDEEKQNLQVAQGYADSGTGQLAYRLVPAQVVQRSPLLAKFAFTDNDLYIEKTKDLVKGEASVEVTHQGKLYTVYLTQPSTKGEKGVWTPTRVTY